MFKSLTFLLLFGALTTIGYAQEQSLLSAAALDEAARVHMDQSRRARMDFTNENAYRFARDAGNQLRSSNSIIWIPIKLHIARDGASFAASIFNSSYYLSKVNEALINANIQLYNCGTINLINDPAIYNLNLANQSALTQHEVPNVLNFFFVNQLQSGATGYCGSADYPGQGNNVIYATRCFGYSAETVITHLIGQFFSLYPTSGPSGAVPELVTRGPNANCSFAGDELCDTPADPNLFVNGGVSNCTYVGTLTDTNGATYQADPTNFMSYGPNNCRDHFTPMQLARMEYSALNDRNSLACSSSPICLQGINQFPYTEGFENGFGLWNNMPYYSSFTLGEFIINSGATPTPNTGPNAASEGIQYAYADASITPDPNNFYAYGVATLESPCFDFSNLINPELRFDYHMWGVDATQLGVQVSVDGGTYYDATGVALNITGDQGNSWQTATVNLANFAGASNVVIRMVAGFNGNEEGDIAIDDIWIGEGNSPIVCNSALSINVQKTDYTCGSVTNGGDAALSIIYSGNGTLTSTWSTGATNVNVLNNLGVGSFWVKVEDGLGCKDSIAFTIDEIPPVGASAVATTTSTATSTDANVDLTVSSGVGPYTFAWSNGATTEDLTGVGIGSYAYTVTDANACTAEGAVFVGLMEACVSTKNGGWPYVLSLDGGLGLFMQNSDDDTNWRRWAGATPTANTGPSGSAEGTRYRYIESSGSGNPGKKAILTTKRCLNLSNVNNPIFRFQYHMFGSQTGSLEVQLSTDGGQTWGESIWELNGDQGDPWYTAEVNLAGYATNATRIRVIGTTGGGALSDIAIDDIYLGERFNNTSNSVVAGIVPIEQGSDRFTTGRTTIFPNPSSTQLNIRLTKVSTEAVSLTVFNRLGQIIPVEVNQIAPGASQVQLPVSDWQAGLYFLRLTYASGQTETKSFVVQ